MAGKLTTQQTLLRYGLLTSVGIVGYFGLDYLARQAGMAPTAGLSVGIGLLVGGLIGVLAAMLGIIGQEDEGEDG
ncbi:MAG: hypothetical protein AAF576_03165 [Pseudomonadota bacterium]